MATKDLGAVTAYAYAKAHGYSGTEAQFETKMGELPQAVLDAQNAVETVTGVQAQATQLATTADPTATYNHTTNKIEFGIPKGNGIASITHTGTSGSVKTYTITFNDGQTTTFDVTDGELTYEYAEENLAFNDGYYDELTAGSAEQLISNIMEEDTKPYVYRTTGGSLDVGDRKTEELVGGTIAWNQILDVDNGSNEPNGIHVSWNNGVYTITGQISVGSVFSIVPASIYNKTKPITGHKYFLDTDIISGDTSNFWFGIYKTGTVKNYTLGTKTIFNQQFNADDSEVVGQKKTERTEDCSFRVALYDLTQMFGSTIADYIYGLEQAEAGAGVAWFKKYFPKSYYAYNAGSLQSVNVASGINTGFNQWDEEWELGSINANGVRQPASNMIRSKNYIPCVGGATYYQTSVAKGSSVIVTYFYDMSHTLIPYTGTGAYNSGANPSDGIVVSPTNARYMLFRLATAYGTTYKNDICINLHWDGERDGEYEPYDAHIYNYDSDLELRGIPSLDEFGNLQYDGDIYESDGTVTRKYGIVDLGSLTWLKNNTNIMTVQFTQTPNTSGVANIICPKYCTTSWATMIGDDKTIAKFNNDYIYVHDTAYNDAATFKAAMSGVYMLYELTTPTEEIAESFTSPQVINDFGTEEWIDAGVQAGTRDVTIPVGHNSTYMVNLRAKLEMAPNSPDGDGLYLVRQKDSENEYVPFTWSGDHPDLSAGSAHQLISTVQENDQTPYLFRTSGGSVDIGDREFINGIVGGTISWNQLARNPNFDSVEDWGGRFSVVSVANNIATVTPTSEGTQRGLFQNTYKVVRNSQISHRYYISADVKPPINCVVEMSFGGGGAKTRTIVGDTWNHVSCIYSPPDNGYTYEEKVAFYIRDSLTTSQEIQYKNIEAHDLTQMFGSTIADHIYNLEQSTAGAGVAFFKKLFPKPYYAYNAGELKSVSGLQSHDMTGFNQWDEEWATDLTINGIGGNIGSKNHIPVVRGASYYVYSGAYRPSANGVRFEYYDADKNSIGGAVRYSGPYTFPDDCCYIKFGIQQSIYGTTYKNDICINLAWDNSRNGEYEPYVKHSYPLDSSLTLRGIPKLDANNELYYDGDIYEADGTVTRKYGIVDLGTLSWTYDSTYDRFLNNDFIIKAVPTDYVVGNLVCTKYATVAVTYTATSGYDKVIGVTNGGKIRIKDISYTDAATFKAGMSGVYLVYELATPTTEEAQPYTTPQIVDDFGTEEFVIDSEIAVPIPVGHDTDYPINLVAKLEMAPNSPDGDGDYVVRQVNGENEYVPLVIPNELPTMPTENGTYRLIVTVTNGTPTLSWVAN